MLLFLILYTILSPVAVSYIVNANWGKDVYSIPHSAQVGLILVGGPLLWLITLYFVITFIFKDN